MLKASRGSVVCSWARQKSPPSSTRKFREQIADLAGFHLLCDQFEADCASGLWQWIPVDDALLHHAMQRYRSLPANTFLRAADALHLTCAAEQGFTAIHTNDRHMMAAASVFGLQAIKL